MMRADRALRWRVIRRPLRLCSEKGWQIGRRCIISPRGTVFETRFERGAIYARKRWDVSLN